MLLESILPCLMLLSWRRAVFEYYLARGLQPFSAPLTQGPNMRMALQLTMIPLFGSVWECLTPACVSRMLNVYGHHSHCTQPCPTMREQEVLSGPWQGLRIHFGPVCVTGSAWAIVTVNICGSGFGLPPCHQALPKAQLTVPVLMDAEGLPEALTWHAETESGGEKDICSSRAQAEGVTFLSKYLHWVIRAFLEFRSLKRSARIAHAFRQLLQGERRG